MFFPLAFNDKNSRASALSNYTVESSGTSYAATGAAAYDATVSRLRAGEYGFMPPGAKVSRNSTSEGKAYTFQVA